MHYKIRLLELYSGLVQEKLTIQLRKQDGKRGKYPF